MRNQVPLTTVCLFVTVLQRAPIKRISKGITAVSGREKSESRSIVLNQHDEN